MEHDWQNDPDNAEHVWEGGYSLQAGAILGRWVSRAEKEGRIHDNALYDPSGAPVEISSDLGFRDTATWWYWQRRIGGFCVLDFDMDHGLEAQDWIQRIDRRVMSNGWKLGKIWLPHDARTRTFQSKHSAIEQFALHFGLHRCGIVEKTSIADRINAARTVIKRCEFHETNCAGGLDGLRAWEFEYNHDLRIFTKEPLHNWASHYGDGFSYGCQIMQGISPKPEEKPRPDPCAIPTLAQVTAAHDKKYRQRATQW
jgi:phage terminase large subunit